MNKDVLLVDDDVLQLRMGETFLSRLGITVHTCESGDSAIRTLESGLRPDLVLTDLNMPGGTGIDLLRFVRTSVELSQLPVIVVSGTADPDEINAVHHLGCSAFFSKPVEVKSLLDKVAADLGLAVREARRYNVEVPGTLRNEHGGFDVTTLDMSTGGMLLATQYQLEIGDECEVMLCFPQASGLGNLDFFCRVVRRGLAADSYGLRFLSNSDARCRQLRRFFAAL